jgi:hypothetical protein
MAAPSTPGSRSTARADEYCTSLLISASVAVIRLERIGAGIVCASSPRFVAEAQSVLQAITHSLAHDSAEAKEAELLKTARDLLQSYLADLPAGTNL